MEGGTLNGQRRRASLPVRAKRLSRKAQEDSDEDGVLSEPPVWKRALLLVGALALAAVLSAAIVALGNVFATRSRLSRRTTSNRAVVSSRDSAPSDEFASLPSPPPPASTSTPHPFENAYIPKQKPKPPQFLTLVASRNPKAVEAYDNKLTDVVLFDYSSDASTQCAWCVHVQHSPGVKWELLETFFHSDWWQTHKIDYKWLWYPDDDLVFQPGDIEKLFRLVDSQHTFKVVQPSLCKGSQVSHPAMLQTVEDKMSIIHMYSIELQQPLGLVSWWETLDRDGVFDGQSFGFGIDAHWTSYIGNERHVGLVNQICAFHPYRGAGHKSGRDDEGGVVREVRKYPTFHEIVQTNIKKWKYSNTAEFYYRSRRVHRVGKGNCQKVCSKVGICLGIVDMADCESQTALESPNATLPDTEGFCTADGSLKASAGKERVCCVCIQEDPQWCHAKFQFCNWGKNWGHRKEGVREQQGLIGSGPVESAGKRSGKHSARRRLRGLGRIRLRLS